MKNVRRSWETLFGFTVTEIFLFSILSRSTSIEWNTVDFPTRKHKRARKNFDRSARKAREIISWNLFLPVYELRYSSSRSSPFYFDVARTRTSGSQSVFGHAPPNLSVSKKYPDALLLWNTILITRKVNFWKVEEAQKVWTSFQRTWAFKLERNRVRRLNFCLKKCKKKKKCTVNINH